MIRRLRRLLPFLLVLATACARPPVMLDRVVVRNATPGMVTDIEVRHEPTRRFGAVSAILPGQEWEIAFAGRPMLAQQAVVSWREADGRQRVVTLVLPQDHRAAAEEKALSLVYLIRTDGEITVSLEGAP